jgi:cytosine/uracil/thiamine/allantoin permease
MDTSIYLWAGYLAFWLLPTIYILRLAKKLKKIEEKK